LPFALAAVAYVLLTGFVIQSFRVEQISMRPTLREGQLLVVDKLTPGFVPYQRDDIVVFRAPGSTESDNPLIKRVVGIGGDNVEVRDGRVWLNGTVRDEPYLDEGTVTNAFGVDTWEVASGSLFVLGDNRGAALDSRDFGLVPIEAVLGRAFARYWPLDRIAFVGGG